MAGTLAGGKKAAETNKAKYGTEYYRSIGRIGGHNGHTGGFAANPELAKIAGARGGRKSRRGKATTCSKREAKAELIEEKIRATYKQLAEFRKYAAKEWSDYEDQTAN